MKRFMTLIPGRRPGGLRRSLRARRRHELLSADDLRSMLQNFFRPSLKRQNKLECLSLKTNIIKNFSVMVTYVLRDWLRKHHIYTTN